MPQNLLLGDSGAELHDFSSQYHHESRCLNLLSRDSSLVWFTNVAQQLPQFVTFRLPKPAALSRVGVFIHGENNQNPKHIEIHVGTSPDDLTRVVDAELEHRAGDWLWRIGGDDGVTAQYVKVVATENFGGSGIYIAKCYAYACPTSG